MTANHNDEATAVVPGAPPSRTVWRWVLIVIGVAAIPAILYFRSFILSHDPMPKTIRRVSGDLTILAAATLEVHGVTHAWPCGIEPVVSRLDRPLADRLMSNPDYRYTMIVPAGAAAEGEGFVDKAGILLAIRRNSVRRQSVARDDGGYPPRYIALELNTLALFSCDQPTVTPMQTLKLAAGTLPNGFTPLKPVHPAYSRALTAWRQSQPERGSESKP